MANADDRRIATKPQEPHALSADRIEELRAAINAGIYTSESILQATARAIIEHGAL